MSEQKQNQIVKAPVSGLAKYASIYDNQIAQMAGESNLKLSTSQKLAVTTGAQHIFSLCKASNVEIKDLDQSNVAQILFNLAMLDLNPNAVPHECYLIIRKNKTGPVVELGLEGDGNDALIRKYGVGVKSLSAPIVVREGDEFTLPYFDGEKMCPPTWKPKTLSSKPILVFYRLVKNDGTIEYLMADRESVASNLKAHIINNMMSATKKSKEPIIKKIENMTLDAMLNDETLKVARLTVAKYDPSSRKVTYEEADVNLISPAYLNPHSREEMIIRKMRNNCLKKYPKSFDNAFLSKAYESTFEDNAINTNNQNVLEADFDVKANIVESNSVLVDEKKKEVKQQVDENGVVDVNEKVPNVVVEQQKNEDDNLPEWMK